MTLPAALLATWTLLQAQPPANDPVETRVYNIEFLTRVVSDSPGQPLGLSGNGITTSAQEPSLGETINLETLVTMIKSNVEEGSWEGSYSISATETTLTITHLKSAHEKIGQYLAYLRAFRGRMVSIDAAFVVADPALIERIRAGGRTAVLSPAQAKQLLDAARDGKEAELVKSLRISCYNGQRVSLRDAVRHVFVSDYNVQLAVGQVMLDPIPGVYATGVMLDVRPVLEPFDNAVTLEVRGDVADAEVVKRSIAMKMSVTVGVSGGKDANTPTSGILGVPTESLIQLPKVTVESIRTTMSLRNQETAIVGSLRHGNRQLLFLMTPTVISIEDKMPPEPVFEEQRQLKIFDISPLTRPLPDFAGPRLDLPEMEIMLSGGATETAIGASFSVDAPTGIQLDPATLVEMVRHQVAPRSWENVHNSVAMGPGGLLMVRQKPDVLKEIEKLLQSLLSSRAQMITTEAVLLGFRKDARATWEKEIPGLGTGGYFIDADKVAKLLAESAKASAIRLVERAEVSSFPQQRVCVSRTRQENYLADYDPQVTTYAGAWDPSVSTLTTGFVLDVRSHFISGTDKVAVELHSSLGQNDMEEVPAGTTTGIGFVQLPHLTGLRWQNNIVCSGDRWTMAAVDSRKVGEENEELILLIRSRANSVK